MSWNHQEMDWCWRRAASDSKVRTSVASAPGTGGLPQRSLMMKQDSSHTGQKEQSQQSQSRDKQQTNSRSQMQQCGGDTKETWKEEAWGKHEEIQSRWQTQWKAPSQGTKPILLYIWICVRVCERERERVCSSIEWKAIDFMCSGDSSEQICWQQFPSLPSRLLTLVFSDSGCLVHVDHAEYGAPGNVHDSSHPSTMVRLLLPILLRVSTPALSRISKLTDTVAQFTRTTCSSVAKSCVTLPPYGPQHTKLPCPSLSPRVCSNSCPLSQWCYLTISSSVFNLLPSTFPSIRVISSESALHIKWPKYWSFSFSICHPNEYSGLISIG